MQVLFAPTSIISKFLLALILSVIPLVSYSIPFSSGSHYIQNVTSELFMSSENGQNKVTTNRVWVQAWEKFSLTHKYGNVYAIRGNNGLYLDYAPFGQLRFNESNLNNALEFHFTDYGDNEFLLTSPDRTKYLISDASDTIDPIKFVDAHYVDFQNDNVFWRIQALTDVRWRPIRYANELLPIGYRMYSQNGQFYLIMQNDGNLVAYHSKTGRFTWHTHTYGNPGTRTWMQGDGNLVIYDSSMIPLWHSHTYNNYGAFLEISDIGDLRIAYSNRVVKYLN